jgi:hypothetical protein
MLKKHKYVSKENHLYIEAGGSRALFPCENSVYLWKEYLRQIIIFKVEKGSFCSKKAYSAELKKHMYLSKENQLC